MNDVSVSVSVPSGPAPSMAALPEARAKITVRDLNFHYGENHALKNINLALGTHRVTAFIGPSGCGKSTLLRIVAGLEAPSEGRVLLDGKAVTRSGPDRGMVFQSYTLFPWLTVKQNVGFGPRQRGLPKDKLDEIAMR